METLTFYIADHVCRTGLLGVFLHSCCYLVTTINPAVLPDGSNVSVAPLPKTNPHVSNKPYSEV